MEKQLNNLGLQYEIIKAVDGKNLTADDLEKYSKEQAIDTVGRELSPGEIGCALSHANIWQAIIEKKHQEALVFEDDVVLGKALVDILNHRHKFPEEWEMINLNTDVDAMPFGEPVFDIYRVAEPMGFANRASAYLIKSSGAEKLLDAVYPIRLAADGLTGRTYITNLVHYAVKPNIVALSNFKSDIWERT